MAEHLQIKPNTDSDFRLILDGHEITDVAAYTLQEGVFDSKNREYTRKLTVEIWLGPKCIVEVQR